MRIRSVKPDFWRDRLMADLPADVRLFYVGLWMEADDAGWLRWDLDEIAADLYPYRPVKARERQVREWSGRLIDRKRVELFPCGHAFIPKLTRHQLSQGGSKSKYILAQHALCSSESGDRRSDTDFYGREGRGGDGKDGEGVGGASDQDPSTALLPNIGDPALRARLLKKAAGQ